MVKVKNCLNCGVSFNYTHENSKFCSEECKIKYRKKQASKKIEGIEGEDYIICKLCGNRVKRIYGKHLKLFHDGVCSEDYKKLFPGAPLTCKNDKQSTSKNSGIFMKEEKWRKWASDKMKGEKNINSVKNTTYKQRKERSPFSKEFYNQRNLSEDDRKNFIYNALKYREFTNRESYWINRGFTKQEAKEKVKERQTTFSLEICIEKYGEEKGLNIWKNRQERWKKKVFNKDTYIGNGSSNISNNFIKELVFYNYDNNKLLYGKKEKFIYDKKFKRAYKYDLTNDTNKKIIEFNGVFWHCKPLLYESTYIHKVKNITAQEIWDYDKRKQDLAKQYGYEILIIWEDDFIKDPEKEIKKCIEFIYEK